MQRKDHIEKIQREYEIKQFIKEQKEEWEREILKFEEQLNNPIPIILENNQQNVAVVDFVPNRIEIWSEDRWQKFADEADDNYDDIAEDLDDIEL